MLLMQSQGNLIALSHLRVLSSSTYNTGGNSKHVHDSSNDSDSNIVSAQIRDTSGMR